MKRRIISIILTLAMCLSLLPTWAGAAEVGPGPANTAIGTSDTNGTKTNADASALRGEEMEEPDIANAAAAKEYFSAFAGDYATKRHMTDNQDRADTDWSIRISGDGDISLLC